MCTATFIPSPEGFIFGANRDESPKRAAEPVTEEISGSTVWYPKDPKAGGTNLAVSKDGRVTCLLNGAFDRHMHNPPYRKSRGQVLLDSLSYGNLESFSIEYQFENIEPFTLVLACNDLVQTLRWTGEESSVCSHDPGLPHIWASRMLYLPEAVKKREDWFESFLARHPDPTLEELKTFHLEAGDGDPANDIVMNRQEMVRTVSSTVIEAYSHPRIIHVDLLRQTSEEFGLRE